MRIHALVLFGASLALGFMAMLASVSAGDLSNPASLNEKAPATYKVKFDTSKGAFVVEVHRDWAPNGADRFYNLVEERLLQRRAPSSASSTASWCSSASTAIRSSRTVLARRATSRTTRSRRATSAAWSPSPPPAPNTRTTQVFINFARQCQPRRPGLRAVRPGDLGHGGRRFALWRVRRRRAARQRSRPGPRPERRQRLSQEATSPSSTTSRRRRSSPKHDRIMRSRIQWQNPKTLSSSRRPRAR